MSRNLSRRDQAGFGWYHGYNRAQSVPCRAKCVLVYGRETIKANGCYSDELTKLIPVIRRSTEMLLPAQYLYSG